MVDIRRVCVLSVENASKRLKINEESRKWAEKSKMGEKVGIWVMIVSDC